MVTWRDKPGADFPHEYGGGRIIAGCEADIRFDRPCLDFLEQDLSRRCSTGFMQPDVQACAGRFSQRPTLVLARWSPVCPWLGPLSHFDQKSFCTVFVREMRRAGTLLHSASKPDPTHDLYFQRSEQLSTGGSDASIVLESMDLRYYDIYQNPDNSCNAARTECHYREQPSARLGPYPDGALINWIYRANKVLFGETNCCLTFRKRRIIRICLERHNGSRYSHPCT